VLTLAALVAAGLVAAAPAVPGGLGDARIDAGSAIFDVATGTYRLEGGVVISRGVIRLRARSARWDPRTSTVEAVGEVLLTDATRVIAAEGVHAVMDGDFAATGVVAFLKSGPVDLTGAASAAAAGACGRNAVTARSARVEGSADGQLRLEGARVTLCDCPGGGPPSWELRAASAVIHPGERVELWWPVVWVTPRFLLLDRAVPVFLLPWISLPLGDRVSGLLAPQYTTSGYAGQVLTLPLFLTLGRSADLTLAPRYAFGRHRTEGRPDSTSGPGLSLEARATPGLGSGGRIQVDGLWDLDRAAAEANGIPGAHRLRLGMAGTWEQRLGKASELRADLDLVGDPLYTRDFTFDILEREVSSRRSAVVASHRLGPLVLEASAAWLEPVEPERPAAPVAPATALADLATLRGGLFGGRLPAFHRWPSLEATLVPLDLFGPLQLSGRTGLVRFAPWSGVTSDGGVDGIGPADRGRQGGTGIRVWEPWQREPGDRRELDGRWEAGERLAVTRLDARIELAAPFTLGERLAVRPFLEGALLGYAFDAAASSRANAWGLGGLELSTRLVRQVGAWRHVVEPRAEWRLGSSVLGRTLPAFGADAWDRAPAVPPGVEAAFAAPRAAAAAPPGAYQQGRLALETRLLEEGREVLRGEVGQELDLRRGRLAELWLAAAAGGAGPIAGEADLRLWPGQRWGGALAPTPLHPSWLDHFSEARVKLQARDGRGDSVSAGLTALGAGGSGRLTAGVDALFDPRPANLGPQAAAMAGGRLRLGPALLGYEVVLPARTSAPLCDATSARTVAPWQPQQQTATLEWDSPCQCFHAKASFSFNDCGDFGFHMSFDLGRVGASAAR
jgi:LPS-assembly protein